MFSEHNEVNVRQLSDGRTQPGVCESLEGNQLHIRLRATSPDGFMAGELVEVDDTSTLFLGIIISKEGSHLLISVEHSLDREALAAIHEVWHRPDDA